MSADLNVIEFPHADLNDIPARMEGVAKLIREGTQGDPLCAVMVLFDQDGTPAVFAWGQTDPVHSIGVLRIGCSWLETNIHRGGT